MKIIKHRVQTWEKIYDLTIYDNDGWRDGCKLGKKSLYTPIDEKEWLKRMIYSTCLFGKNCILFKKLQRKK